MSSASEQIINGKLLDGEDQYGMSCGGEERGHFVASIHLADEACECSVFDPRGSLLSQIRKTHWNIDLQPGVSEMSANGVWRRHAATAAVTAATQSSLPVSNLHEKDVACAVGQAMSSAQIEYSHLAAVGITNQRGSALVWDKTTGQPLHPVMVGRDSRLIPMCSELELHGGVDRYRNITGVLISCDSPAVKLLWLLDNVPGLREAAERGDALFGTLDSWLVWKLTNGLRHVTDITNASSTMLMSLEKLQWDDGILNELRIPLSMLPKIVSSSELVCPANNPDGLLNGVPISGIICDRQAALLAEKFCGGHKHDTCLYDREAHTIMLETKDQIVLSRHPRLQTTVAFKLGHRHCVYAIEGTMVKVSSSMRWRMGDLWTMPLLRNNEWLASTVDDNGGVYLVPPPEANLAGTFEGYTKNTTNGHIVRAALESTAFQISDLVKEMQLAAGVSIRTLVANKGLTSSGAVMQFQADILGVQVDQNTTAPGSALGAAFAAGLAVDVWPDPETFSSTSAQGNVYASRMTSYRRKELQGTWRWAGLQGVGVETEHISTVMDEEDGGVVADAEDAEAPDAAYTADVATVNTEDMEGLAVADAGEVEEMDDAAAINAEGVATTDAEDVVPSAEGMTGFDAEDATASIAEGMAGCGVEDAASADPEYTNKSAIATSSSSITAISLVSKNPFTGRNRSRWLKGVAVTVVGVGAAALLWGRRSNASRR